MGDQRYSLTFRVVNSDLTLCSRGGGLITLLDIHIITVFSSHRS